MLKNSFSILVIAVSTALLAGICSALFLHALSWVTELRNNHLWLVWSLPIFGFTFGHLVKRLPHHINQGVPYILQELDNQNAHVSPWMTPYIFLSSLGTHLFGGSAGREGVGVIMGVSMSHLIPNFRSSYKELRPYLIYCGVAAGFSSIFGTPLAGVAFTFELHAFKDIKVKPLFLAVTVSSFLALLPTYLLNVEHQSFLVNIELNASLIFYIVAAAIAAALGGQIFYWSLKGYTKLISMLTPHLEWKLFYGSLAISVLVYLTQGYAYVGIGSDFIAKSFVLNRDPYDFIMKCILTVMTIAIGFKGGEVTPLFFMGATLSNSFAAFLKLRNYSLSSALGMVSLFGAVTGTPIASAFLALELFGLKAGICSVVSCLLARTLMGNKTVYRH